MVEKRLLKKNRLLAFSDAQGGAKLHACSVYPRTMAEMGKDHSSVCVGPDDRLPRDEPGDPDVIFMASDSIEASRFHRQP